MTEQTKTIGFLDGPSGEPSAFDITQAPFKVFDQGVGKPYLIQGAGLTSISNVGTDVAITSDQFRSDIIEFNTGGGAAAINYLIPSTDVATMWVMQNNTAFAINVQASTTGLIGGATGTGISLLPGQTAILFWDGTNVNRVGSNIGTVTVAMTSADVTLTADQSAASVVVVTGTGAHNLIFTSPLQRDYTIANTSSGSVVVKCASGATITVATTKSAILRWDGTNWVRVTADT